MPALVFAPMQPVDVTQLTTVVRGGADRTTNPFGTFPWSLSLPLVVDWRSFASVSSGPATSCFFELKR